jgi:hypothetical protein
MKNKRIAQSAFLRLYILLGLIVFFAGALFALFASGSPQALTRDRTHLARELHRANPSSVAPSGGVYEAWVARYNGPANNYDEARAIAVDTAGNVYVGGYSWGEGTRIDYTTIKYSSAGNQEWVARYNGPVNDDDQLIAMAVDGSGNVYVTGYSVVDNNSHFDCVTIKYDSAGQEQWVAHYTAPSGYAAGDAVALDGSGNVYVAAEAAIPNDPNTRFCVTIKYNTAGEEQWVSEYDGGMNNNQPAAIAVDSASNVYVTGHIRACPVDEYQTFKYDLTGQERWVARYQGPGTGGDSANAIAVDNSGNVYVTGTSYTSGISSSTIKYNSAGQQQWVARYEQGDYAAQALTLDGFSNVYVTGLISDQNRNGFADYGTVKYNSSGQQQWLARYSGPGGNSSHVATGVALDSSGNVYVT